MGIRNQSILAVIVAATLCTVMMFVTVLKEFVEKKQDL
jgi:hypothetical protein